MIWPLSKQTRESKTGFPAPPFFLCYDHELIFKPLSASFLHI